jgi:prevent-host-death family protein
MINITEDIHSLTNFKNNTNDFICSLKKSGRPAILTVNGKAELVVMDAAAYQKIQEQMEFEETISEINQSLKDFEMGNFLPAEDVFNELRQRIVRSKKKSTKVK